MPLPHLACLPGVQGPWLTSPCPMSMAGCGRRAGRPVAAGLGTGARLLSAVRVGRAEREAADARQRPRRPRADAGDGLSPEIRQSTDRGMTQLVSTRVTCGRGGPQVPACVVYRRLRLGTYSGSVVGFDLPPATAPNSPLVQGAGATALCGGSASKKLKAISKTQYRRRSRSRRLAGIWAAKKTIKFFPFQNKSHGLVSNGRGRKCHEAALANSHRDLCSIAGRSGFVKNVIWRCVAVPAPRVVA